MKAWTPEIDYSNKDNLLSPLKAIRAQCKLCTCGQLGEIRECHILTCPLWPYRFGKRPDTSNVWQSMDKA